MTIRYCRRCILPETKPDLRIDEEGVCNACRNNERRPEKDGKRARGSAREFSINTAGRMAAITIASCPEAAVKTAHFRSSRCLRWVLTPSSSMHRLYCSAIAN
jgi:hypothetical protein